MLYPTRGAPAAAPPRPVLPPLPGWPHAAPSFAPVPAPSTAARPRFNDFKLHSPLPADENGVPQVRPWVRFLARQVDQVLLASVLLVPLSFLWRGNVGGFVGGGGGSPRVFCGGAPCPFCAPPRPAPLPIPASNQD